MLRVLLELSDYSVNEEEVAMLDLVADRCRHVVLGHGPVRRRTFAPGECRRVSWRSTSSNELSFHF